jgi:hypothetical protein
MKNMHKTMILRPCDPAPPGRCRTQGLGGSLLLMVCLLWGNPSLLQGQKIVVPNEFAEINGDTHLTTANVAVHGIRNMHLYDASQFQALTKPAYLTGYALRPDQTPGPSGPRTLVCKIYVSTTARSLNEVSTHFSDNIGSDNSLVFDGTLIISTENLAGPGNTRQFDYSWRFTTPFLYDPTAGNLVVDLQIIQGTGEALRFDHVSASPVIRHVRALDSATAADGQLISGSAQVVQFTFEPVSTSTNRASRVEVSEGVSDATNRVNSRSKVSQED